MMDSSLVQQYFKFWSAPRHLVAFSFQSPSVAFTVGNPWHGHAHSILYGTSLTSTCFLRLGLSKLPKLTLNLQSFFLPLPLPPEWLEL